MLAVHRATGRTRKTCRAQQTRAVGGAPAAATCCVSRRTKRRDPHARRRDTAALVLGSRQARRCPDHKANQRQGNISCPPGAPSWVQESLTAWGRYVMRSARSTDAPAFKRWAPSSPLSSCTCGRRDGGNGWGGRCFGPRRPPRRGCVGLAQPPPQLPSRHWARRCFPGTVAVLSTFPEPLDWRQVQAHRVSSNHSPT
jgi:hypothetical protein